VQALPQLRGEDFGLGLFHFATVYKNSVLPFSPIAVSHNALCILVHCVACIVRGLVALDLFMSLDMLVPSSGSSLDMLVPSSAQHRTLMRASMNFRDYDASRLLGR